MSEFVSVLQGEGSSTVVTVSKEYAEGAGLEILDQPAVDRRGVPLGAREVEPPPSDLKGAALDEALEEVGLPKSGTVAEKRKRLADHTTSQQPPAGTDSEEGSA